MPPFYLESTDNPGPARADQTDRWDADDNFWRIDTWTEAELCDDKRFAHYLAGIEQRKTRRANG